VAGCELFVNGANVLGISADAGGMERGVCSLIQLSGCLITFTSRLVVLGERRIRYIISFRRCLNCFKSIISLLQEVLSAEYAMYILLFGDVSIICNIKLHLASIDLLDQVSCIAIGGTRNGTFSGIPKTTDNAVRLLPML